MANHAPLSSASSPFLTHNTVPTSRAAKYACARVLCPFSVSMSLSVCLCVCDSSCCCECLSVLSNKTFRHWIFRLRTIKTKRFINHRNTTHTQSLRVLSTLHEIIQGSAGCALACTTRSLCPLNTASTRPSRTSTYAIVPSNEAGRAGCVSICAFVPAAASVFALLY
jgi:hypothetical protein